MYTFSDINPNWTIRCILDLPFGYSVQAYSPNNGKWYHMFYTRHNPVNEVSVHNEKVSINENK